MDIPDRYKMIASGYMFLIKDSRILLARRLNTGYQDGKYAVPAGHIEEHETVKEGLRREIQEELGLHLELEDLTIAHVMHRHDEDDRLDFFFLCTKWSGEPQNMEPQKCDDLQWFDLDHLPKTIIPYIKAAIEFYRQGIIYSEYGWQR